MDGVDLRAEQFLHGEQMQKMGLWVAFLSVLVSGCTMPPTFLSRGNACLEIQEVHLQCQEKSHEYQEVIATLKREVAKLEDTTAQLEEDRCFLYRKVEDLNRTIERQQSVVSLQKAVISLFDDSNHSMQTNIEEQLAAQTDHINSSCNADRWVFTNDSLFVPQTTVLSAAGEEQLKRVVHELGQKDDIFVRVEGHADDRRLRETADYADNWELSALRAAAVVSFLQHAGSLPAERLSATGYGYYQPVVSNESPAGRQQNSRIEIVTVKAE